MCRRELKSNNGDQLRLRLPRSSRDNRSSSLCHFLLTSALSFTFVVVALLLPLDRTTNIAVAGSTELASLPHAPKRGKYMGDKFSAKELYDAYKEVESEYHEKAFGKASSWKVLASRQGVEVSMMEHPSEPTVPYIKMVAEIPTAVETCWNWLKLENWPTNMPKMDPFYEGVEIHGSYDHKGVNMILARKRTKRILAFGKRDMVFLSVIDRPLSDGTLVSGSVSVQTPRIPRQKGYTRAFQDSIAFYKPLKGNTRSKITIVCRIDLNDSSADGNGGWMPMWLYVKTIGATGVKSVTSMRDVIVTDQKGKKDDEISSGNLTARRHQKFWQLLEGKGNSASQKVEVTDSDGSSPTNGFFSSWIKQECQASLPTASDQDSMLPKPRKNPIFGLKRLFEKSM